MALLSFQKPAVAALCKHFRTRETAKFGDLEIHPPIIVNASVSSGKSLMLAECAKAVREAALAKEKPSTVYVLVIQRQGLLAAQNSDASWSIGLNNSVFSASAGGKKSTHFQVVYATEGTLARALETYRFSEYTPEELAMTHEQRARLKKWHPDLVLIDEGHQVPFDQPEAQYMRILLHFYKCKPHMRLGCMTGSPFRGVQSIVGDSPQHLWKKVASIEPSDPDYPEGGVGNGIISTNFMIDQAWVVPPIFGFPDDEDNHYDFSHLAAQEWEYREDELDAAVSDKELCLRICADFVKKAEARNGVLIFASTQRHTRQIAAALKKLGVDESQIGIITDKTPQKEQTRILDLARKGLLKYTINVAVLTTGVNVTAWDTVVFMRPIGAIVLLIQAIGRILRLLIEEGEMGMVERDALTAEMRRLLIQASGKPDALVLDYAGCMDALRDLYDNPVLEQAELEKAKKEKKDLITCPICETLNSPNARRCISRDDMGNRCEWFWHSRNCPSCGTQNDQVARECRNQDCRRLLVDPNAALSGKHYTDGESIPVRAMKVESGRGGKLMIRFDLADGRQPQLIYYPHAGKQPALNSKIWKGFVKMLPISDRDAFRLGAMKAETIMQNLHLIPVPTEVSVRENKGRWTCGRMKFDEQPVLLGEAV